MNTDLIATKISDFLGKDAKRLPYFGEIIRALGDELVDSPFCSGLIRGRVDCPCMLELIWSYWHEEGMLVQSLNAISMRFQNKRSAGDRDPLAHLDLAPLRPLNNFIWGYIQDEGHRLTLPRRAYEYDHHYGLKLVGKAVPKLRSVDSRSKFIEAFHSLLHLTSTFYQDASDTNIEPDGFPLLNGLKEVHLLLAYGAHNQYGDLPWTARVEMLIQQWLLGRPEMARFLAGRAMVPYPEAWMDRVDTMNKLQGWTDVSVRHFHDLGEFGERILLSVRFGNWSVETDDNAAKNWAEYWRQEVRGYMHAYRAVTGVDLTADVQLSQDAAVRNAQPSAHLSRRLAEQKQS